MATRLEGSQRREALDTLAATGWVRDEKRDAIRKEFRFRNFAEAFGWMTSAALIAEKMNHHPEWSNVYNRVSVLLTTHDAGGLTELDIRLARRMDGLEK